MSNFNEENDGVAHEERVTISRAALRLELLEMEVRLKDFFLGRLSMVEDAVRKLESINDLRTAAETALAVETERLRKETEAVRITRAAALETPMRQSIMRTNKALIVGVCISALIAITAIVTLYVTHG